MSTLKAMVLGGRGFASVERILAGLTLDTALRRVDGLPFSIYSLLWHLEFCQNVLLQLVMNEDVQFPDSSEQWPQGEPSEEEWEELLDRLKAGLYEASELAANPPGLEENDRELLEDLTSHSAYHWGQVVVMRRLLGDWAEPMKELPA